MIKKTLIIVLIFLFSFQIAFLESDTEKVELGETIIKKSNEERFELEVLEVVNDNKVIIEIEEDGKDGKTYEKTLSKDSTLNILNDFEITIIDIDNSTNITEINFFTEDYFMTILDDSKVWCKGDEAELRVYSEEDYENKNELERKYEDELESLKKKLEREEEKEDRDNDDINEIKDDIENLKDEYFNAPSKIKVTIYDGPFSSSPLIKEIETDDFGRFNFTFEESKYYFAKVHKKDKFLSSEKNIRVEVCNYFNDVEEEENKTKIQSENETIEDNSSQANLEDLNNNISQNLSQEENFTLILEDNISKINTSLSNNEIEETNQNDNLVTEAKTITLTNEKQSNSPILLFGSIFLIAIILGFAIFIIRNISKKNNSIKKSEVSSEVKTENTQSLDENILNQTIAYLEKHKDTYSKESLNLVLQNHNISQEIIKEAFERVYN